MPIKVLHIAPAFYPAVYWGGPTFSVYALCNALADSGKVDLRVLTTDTAGPRLSDRVEEAQVGEQTYPGYRVTFTRRMLGRDFAPGLIGRLLPFIGWADVVHLTGVYCSPTIPTLLVARMLGKPMVWSPRGALQRWGGSTRPGLKGLWNGVCRLTADTRRLVLHVTSEEEGKESAAQITGARVVRVPNGVEIPLAMTRREWRPDGRLRLLYIGRLHQKKGIENLLRAMSLFDDPRIELRICGTGESVYEAALRDLVHELKLEARTRFVGHVDGAAKSREFFSSDITVVPSFTENFAMVVAESLAHGTPVVVGRGAPWAEIETQGAGLWIDNSPGSIAEAVKALRDADLESMGSRGRAWMQLDFGWAGVARQMIGVYAETLRKQTELLSGEA